MKLFYLARNLITGCFIIFLSGASVSQAASGFTQKQLDSALKEIKAEPKVKDAIWASPGVLKAGVYADGTSKDGYAQYLCMVLYDHGFKGKSVLVRVIDIVKLTRDDKWVNIGKATCQ